VVGVIGRNGSGKSTLLKILSQITEPTEGSAVVRGEIGALLEVGTGFHPELTGRENVFLNGSIIGMRRSLVAERFDEIVDFAGVAGFLDTPVKRWSSGMTVRLAFAVAAHLEPEILLIDEVLAVGDAAFQRRCLEKMGTIARDGRTVLFVSHHMGLVQSLCPRAVMLRAGSVVADGPVDAVVEQYLGSLQEDASDDLLDRDERNGAGRIRLRQVHIGEHAGGAGAPESIAGPKTITVGRSARFVFQLTDGGTGLACSFTVYDQQGHPVTFFDSEVAGASDLVGAGPSDQLTCELPQCLLMPGRYRINAAVYLHGELQDHLEGAAFFDVVEGPIDGRVVTAHTNYGSTVIPHRWVLP
jgi:lipopolysaccharide transport system ATP-binding protein